MDHIRREGKYLDRSAIREEKGWQIYGYGKS